MAKMSKKIQVYIPNWMDEWFNDHTAHMGIGTSDLVRLYCQVAIYHWVRFTEGAQCEVMDELLKQTDLSREDIVALKCSPEEMDIILDEVGFLVRKTIQEHKFMKKK